MCDDAPEYDGLDELEPAGEEDAEEGHACVREAAIASVAHSLKAALKVRPATDTVWATVRALEGAQWGQIRTLSSL
jgi:hypothetical protein